MTKKAKVQTLTIAIITVLVVILIFQNTEPVTTKLLFISIELPRIVLLVVTLLVGFAAGFTTRGYTRNR